MALAHGTCMGCLAGDYDLVGSQSQTEIAISEIAIVGGLLPSSTPRARMVLTIGGEHIRCSPPCLIRTTLSDDTYTANMAVLLLAALPHSSNVDASLQIGTCFMSARAGSEMLALDGC